MLGKFTDSNGYVILKPSEPAFNDYGYSGFETEVEYKLPVIKTYSISKSSNTELAFTRRLSNTHLGCIISPIEMQEVTVNSVPDSVDSTEIDNTNPLNDNSLVNQYRFDGDLNDNLGNSNGTGTVTYLDSLHTQGIGIDTSSLNQGDLVFDSNGSDSLVTEGTISFYFNLASVPTGLINFIGTKSNIDGTSVDNTWNFSIDENKKCRFTFFNTSSDYFQSNEFELVEDVWYYVGFTFQQNTGITCFIYNVDTGVQELFQLVLLDSAKIFQTSQHVAIGKGTVNNLTGIVDHLELFNKYQQKNRIETLLQRNTYYKYNVSLDNTPISVVLYRNISVFGDIDSSTSNLNPVNATTEVKKTLNYPIAKEKFQYLEQGGNYSEIKIASTEKNITIVGLRSITPVNHTNITDTIAQPLGDGSCTAYYPFDGDLRDYSGNGNDVEMSYYGSTSQYNGSYRFDLGMKNTGLYTRCSSTYGHINWYGAKPPIAVSYITLWSKDERGIFYQNSNRILFTTTKIYGKDEYNFTGKIDLTKWNLYYIEIMDPTHVKVVCNAKYIDIIDLSKYGWTIATSDQLIAASFGSGGSYKVYGFADEARIWNRPLSIAELEFLYLNQL